MWTEQTVETLKKFASEGKSAAWIAVALGAPSRNAVIGKANRIGIKLNGTRFGPMADGSAQDPPQPRTPWGGKRASRRESGSGAEGSQLAVVAWDRQGARPRRQAAALFRGALRADRRSFALAEIGEMRRIGFAEIGDVQCRWPLGDPLQEDFAYCGLQVAKGHAYCAGHCRLAYRPPDA